MISNDQIVEWMQMYESCKPEYKEQMLRTLIVRVREDTLADVSAIAKKLNDGVKLTKTQAQTGVHPRMMYHKFGRRS